MKRGFKEICGSCYQVNEVLLNTSPGRRYEERIHLDRGIWMGFRYVKKYPVEIPVGNVKFFFPLLSLSLEMGSCVVQLGLEVSVTKDKPELLDFLLFPPECWDSRCELPCQVSSPGFMPCKHPTN